MSFPAYPQYKESGVEWLGEVPEHWSVQPLKRAIEKVESGTSVNAADYPAEDGALGVLKTSCVYTGRFDWTENKTVDESDLQRVSCPLRLNTLIVSRMNTPELVGATGLVEFAPDGVFLPDRLWQVYFDRKSSPAFFYYFTKSSEYRGQVKIACSGTSASMQNLGQEDFGSLLLAKPPVSEQTQIARFLDHETTRIDALIEEQQRLIELLKEKRQAMISHAVTKGLDPTVPMKDSGVEWLGEVPEHWNVGVLRWYATIQGGIAKGKDYEGRETVVMPYLRVANVQSGYVDLTEVKEIAVLDSEVERYRLRAGDVLMNEGGDNDKLGRGTVWQAQIEPCLHQNHVFAIRPVNLLKAEWLAAFTQSEQARAYFYLNSKQSTNLASISASNVMSLALPIPSLNEQQEILAYLEEDRLQHEQLTNVALSTVELLQERRSALISAAVTGKIDVRGWQPPADTPSPESAIAEAH